MGFCFKSFPFSLSYRSPSRVVYDEVPDLGKIPVHGKAWSYGVLSDGTVNDARTIRYVHAAIPLPSRNGQVVS